MDRNMPKRGAQVRAVRTRSKSDVQGKLAAGWARVTAGRKGAFVDACDTSMATVNRALTGESLPELHTALNSLAFDATALDEVLALYGVRLAPLMADAANDLATISGLAALVATFTKALEDGHRDHRETCVLADAIRPLMVALSAICTEADGLRAA